MKSKDRRPGQRAQAPGAGASLPDYLFGQGLRSHQAGQLAVAEQHYRQAIAIEPNHAHSHYCLGLIALQTGQHAQAIGCLEQAIALNGREPDWHYNVAVAYQHEGRFADAMAHFRRTVALDPAHIPAKINIANRHASLGELDQAAAIYRGVIDAKPDQLDAQENLARVFLTRGQAVEAVALLQQAFRLGATPGMKQLFVQCARQLRLIADDTQFRQLVLRALTEAWGRPSELAVVSVSLIKTNPDIAKEIERAAAAWPRRLAADELFGSVGMAALDADRLLLQMLQSTFIADVALERFLTDARLVLLDRALAANVLRAPGHAFFAALAQQCFINEYVFAATADELERAGRLRDALNATAASDAPLRPECVMAVAAYFPLHQLPNAALLMQRDAGDAIGALLVQQIREPAEEAALRASMPRATPIDTTSGAVQAQYEQNPYPRWIRAMPVAPRASFDEHMRISCPRAPYRALGKGGGIDILIAGCGTGQTAVEIAQQFPVARILAIDLSLASLAYAKRKARQAGVANIEFAQADLLRLRDLGRSFDMVESRGVLHHLDDPLAGWRALLSVLRPNGVMEIGLYSEMARREVAAARALIAERGYRPEADDIRRFRQDVMALQPDAPLKSLVRGDFFTTSGCRDLLFHVREQRVSLPGIQDFLGRERLRMLGFNLPEATLQRYATRFPNDKSLTDLELWHAFETEFPYTFRGMYQFWVQAEG